MVQLTRSAWHGDHAAQRAWRLTECAQAPLMHYLHGTLIANLTQANIKHTSFILTVVSGASGFGGPGEYGLSCKIWEVVEMASGGDNLFAPAPNFLDRASFWGSAGVALITRNKDYFKFIVHFGVNCLQGEHHEAEKTRGTVLASTLLTFTYRTT
jgi:hypothetical protein